MQFWFLYVLALCMFSYLIFTRVGGGELFFALIGILFYFTLYWDLSLGNWEVLYLFRLNLVYFSMGVAAHGLLSWRGEDDVSFRWFMALAFGGNGLA